MSNINQDIQASHKILTLLEEANLHSEYILDTIPGVFIIINEKFKILRGNIEFSQMFGIPYENILHTDFSSLFDKEIWALFVKHFLILHHDDNKKSVQFELSIQVQKKLGIEKPFYWHLTKMHSGNGAEGNIYTLMGEDISQLRESEKKLLSIFSSIPLGILTINEKGLIEDTYSNYLSCLLGEDDFDNKSFKEIIFDPIREDLTRDERKGIENILLCLNNDIHIFEMMMPSFPNQIFFYKADVDDACLNLKTEIEKGKYLKISYKPVVYEGIVKRLLIIIEDRSTIIRAEKEEAKAKEIKEKSKAIYETAIRDPLTGLYTRLYMEEAVDELLKQCNNDILDQVSLLLFDIDHFKAVNDTYGHDIGDVVLKEVASVILSLVGEEDIPIRFGGEEFLVFIPKEITAGFSLAEKIRTKVENLVINIGEKTIGVTISGGITAYLPYEEVNQFIKRADTLLYQAKENGRNQNIYAL